MSELRVIFSTAPDRDTAETIASRLVEDRLVACVQLVPGLTSVYRWQGEIHKDPEILLIIKTQAELVSKTLKTLENLHPYEVPEGVVLDVADGLPAFLQWVMQETQDSENIE